MRNLLVTFSGGRTSAIMCRLIKLSAKYFGWNIVFVFANVGKEREKTLVFVDKCDKEFDLNLVWIEAVINPKKGDGVDYRIVDFETACRDGSVFESMIKKYGIPSKGARDCTKYLKERPIHKFARQYFEWVEFNEWVDKKYSSVSLRPTQEDFKLTTLYQKFKKENKNTGNYLTATGIRADEPHRFSSDPLTVHPLVEFGIDEKFVRGWWKNQPFDLDLKDYEGNCDLCFLKSTRKRLTIIKDDPAVADWWNLMEEKYSSEVKPMFDVYRGKSISDLVELAKGGFRPAVDKQEEREYSPEIFDTEYDMEFDCFCKAN